MAMNITEVADALGIQDSNYFSRLFHRFAGISPSGYRHCWRQVPSPVDFMNDITNHRRHPWRARRLPEND